MEQREQSQERITKELERLREIEIRYRNITENAKDIIYTHDLTGRYTYLNKAGERLTGYTREEALTMNLADIIAAEQLESVRRRIGEKLAGAEQSVYEAEIIRRDGSRITVEASSWLLYENGEPVGVQGIARDVTERKIAEEKLQESEERYRVVAETATDVIVTIDENSRILFVNKSVERVFGYAAPELLGESITMLMSEHMRRAHQAGIGRYVQTGKKQIDWKAVELSGLHKNGQTIPLEISFGEFAKNGKHFFTGIIRDITERKRAEEQLLHDAFHDSLTGLANRALFMDHLRMTIERCKRNRDRIFAVLFLDFDRFKVINDSLGHAEGDNLLKQIAARLESSTRGSDLVARFGGDEFIILLGEIREEVDAVQIAERIQNNLKNPFDLSENEIFVSASIGIALSSVGGGKSAEDMVRNADIAMYHAKAGGKAHYQIFDQGMHEQASRKLQLETDMRRALERREFELHYQPIINLESEKLVGFEALVRWKHPARGMIPPSEFIGAAEENNLILPLGNWVLRESCRQLREWQNQNPAASDLIVSVNLSGRQFSQSDLAEQIAAALSETGLDARCLKLEITESQIMETSETAAAMLERLRFLGIELSLDDFGTGYSSLSYLHRLPVNYLKIDRSFVSRMAESRENFEIVRTIIRLARNLKMKTIAEGIETAEQLAQLKKLNCEYGQGYFFSKPLEPEQARMFIG